MKFFEKQIVLDTETTGLSVQDGHRIIEIGAVELYNRRRTGKYFHCYFNPERSVDKEALAVHGITDEYLLAQPFFRDRADEFMEFIKDAEVIIHNAPFDVGFLKRELELTEKKFPDLSEHCKITDSLYLARQKHPGQPNSLDALCRRYQIDNSHREYHGALLDAELLAEIYLALTGGQGNLFVVNEQQINEKLSKVFKTERSGPLPIIFANASELLAHRNYLTKMQAKCPIVVWLDNWQD